MTPPVRITIGGLPRARRRTPAGLVLVVIGATLLFPGVILWGLCAVAGGVVCSGTPLGDIGGAFLLIGGLVIIAGIAALVVFARAAAASGPPARPADVDLDAVFRGAQGAGASLQLSSAVAAGAAPPGPVPSECPKCGGPVKRGSTVCEWCGQPFL